MDYLKLIPQHINFNNLMQNCLHNSMINTKKLRSCLCNLVKISFTSDLVKERSTPGDEVPGSIPAVAAGSLLVGSVVLVVVVVVAAAAVLVVVVVVFLFFILVVLYCVLIFVFCCYCCCCCCCCCFRNLSAHYHLYTSYKKVMSIFKKISAHTYSLTVGMDLERKMKKDRNKTPRKLVYAVYALG